MDDKKKLYTEWAKLGVPKQVVDEHIARSLAGFKNVEPSQELLEKAMKDIPVLSVEAIIFDWIGTLYERNKGLYSFSEKVLEELKPQYKFGLITIAKNGIEARKEELEKPGVLHYFDSVIIDTSKTPEHYLRCIDEMGTTPEKTLIVDDRTIRGIKVGNQLDCPTFWVQTGEYAHETPNKETGEPTYRINSVEDLLFLKK